MPTSLHPAPAEIRQVGFDQIVDSGDADCLDKDIAVHRDLRELLVHEGSMRIDMYALVICLRGRLQAEVNAVTYTLVSNSLLVGYPNNLIGSVMLSPDFEGGLLCLSQRIITECLSDGDLWEHAFHMMENPVVCLSGENLQMFALYRDALLRRLQIKTATPFRREIILSIVRAAIYELLAVAPRYNPEAGRGITRSRDYTFQRFISLLSGTAVKPRSLAWYASRLCITPKYLSAICKEVSGKSASAWIVEYTIVDIRHYLRNTSMTVKEISVLLGFPNLSFFGKYCKQHLGASPNEYRRQMREQET